MTPRLDHLVIEIVALAGALADPGENRVAAVSLGDIVDELLDEHRLAHPSTAEEPDLPALGVGGEQVDDLDPGNQHLGLGGLVGEGGGIAVDGEGARALHRAALVNRLADDIEDAPERLRPDRNLNGPPGVAHLGAAHEALGRIHGDGAHRVLAEVLRDLQNEALAEVLGLQRVEDHRQLAFKVDVHHRAHHLGDPPCAVACLNHGASSLLLRACSVVRARCFVRS